MQKSEVVDLKKTQKSFDLASLDVELGECEKADIAQRIRERPPTPAPFLMQPKHRVHIIRRRSQHPLTVSIPGQKRDNPIASPVTENETPCHKRVSFYDVRAAAVGDLMTAPCTPLVHETPKETLPGNRPASTTT